MKRFFCIVFSLMIFLSMLSCGKNSVIETSYFESLNTINSESTSETTESLRVESSDLETSSSATATETVCSETSVQTDSKAASETTEAASTSESYEESTSVVFTETEQTVEITETTTPLETTDSTEATEEMVWVSVTGKKYHAKKTCSNMKNPSYVSLTEAKSSGYEPCKKCYKS